MFSKAKLIGCRDARHDASKETSPTRLAIGALGYLSRDVFHGALNRDSGNLVDLGIQRCAARFRL
jgi:hypothetical protein